MYIIHGGILMGKDEERYKEKRSISELQRIFKGSNKKSVVWRLTKKTKRLVEEKYEVEAVLYRIRTKHLKGISDIKNPKLRYQHFCYKQNKKTIVLFLTSQDKEDFIQMGVRFFPEQYLIKQIKQL